jgi:hypothetical protein
MLGPREGHDADRLAAQSGTRQLFDRCEKAVEVEIKALNLCRAAHAMDFVGRKAI